METYIRGREVGQDYKFMQMGNTIMAILLMICMKVKVFIIGIKINIISVNLEKVIN